MVPEIPRDKRQSSAAGPGDIAIASGVTALAVAIAFAAEQLAGLASPALILILGVIVAAIYTGRRAALAAAVFSFLAYDFLFVQPRLSFVISRPDEVVAVATFLLVALLVGQLAARLRDRLNALRAANERVRAGLRHGRALASAADVTAAYRATLDALAQAAGAQAVLFARHDGRFVPLALEPQAHILEADAIDAATRELESGAVASDSSIPARAWWWRALPSDVLLGLRLPDMLADDAREGDWLLAQGMVDDLEQTLRRIGLVAQLEEARMVGETERLRAALLASVSHDLRSPLATMIGAASSLREYGEAMTASDRSSLSDAILQEGRRLDRYIQNLLDMTRLGHGGLRLAREWIGVDDIIGAAVARVRKLGGARIGVVLAEELPLLHVHPALLEQALFNVLENASKFSPPDGEVSVNAFREGETLIVDIEDEGPGIPAAERERVFDLFYTVSRGDRSGAGTGLGLAISQGMIAAHGGRVEVMDPARGSGTLMRIRLPLPLPPEPEGDEA